MVTKFYVDSNGNYLGGFAGVEPPKGSIEVPSAPDNASDKWLNGAWVQDIGYWRENCTVSDIQLRKALIEQGLYETVETQVKTAPLLMRMLWDRATTLKRLDVDLVDFAKTQLSMADSEIDDLFKLAETK